MSTVMFEQLSTRQIANVTLKLIRYKFSQEEADRFLSDESTDVRYPGWLQRDRQRQFSKKHYPLLHQICGDSCAADE